MMMCWWLNFLGLVCFLISDTLRSQLDSQVDVLIRAKVLRYWNAVEVLQKSGRFIEFHGIEIPIQNSLRLVFHHEALNDCTYFADLAVVDWGNVEK